MVITCSALCTHCTEDLTRLINVVRFHVSVDAECGEAWGLAASTPSSYTDEQTGPGPGWGRAPSLAEPHSAADQLARPRAEE